jgi:hypothetical protein
VYVVLAMGALDHYVNVPQAVLEREGERDRGGVVGCDGADLMEDEVDRFVDLPIPSHDAC